MNKLYYKKIEGKTVISSCKTLQLADGSWVSNPTEETIYNEGWQDYVAPTPEPTPQTEPTLDDRVAAFERLMNVGSIIVALDEEAALQVIALFPAWIEQVGKDLHVGERYYYDEGLWKVLQDHTAQEDWHPDVAPSLFVKVSIEDGSLEHPITFSQGMILENGKYYTQNGIEYLCVRESTIGIYANLEDLVGNYVKVA